ncbi:hypothetical protein [Neisseria elongata]|uniref:hypothetical protein n=1 Tax=Neisseria elongata TaxID=495 RepID=UPI000D30FBAC|nr:hypothetical protein [Neisseria elongata]
MQDEKITEDISMESAYEFDDNRSMEADLEMDAEGELNIDLDDLDKHPEESDVEATALLEEGAESDEYHSELMDALEQGNEEVVPDLQVEHPDENVSSDNKAEESEKPENVSNMLVPESENFPELSEFLNKKSDPYAKYIHDLVRHLQSADQIPAPEKPVVAPNLDQTEQLRTLAEIVAKLSPTQQAGSAVVASGDETVAQPVATQEGTVTVPAGTGMLVKGVGNFISGLSRLSARGLNELGNVMRRVAETGVAVQEEKPDFKTELADIQMVREESSLPDSMLYRLENLRIAQEDYQAGLEGFWQEEKMSRVRDKIREYAEENGMSEQDVIAGINKDTDMNLSEISQVFNEAYENSPAAKTAKEKMDHALNDWKDSYSSLTEDFGYGDADNSDYRRAFGQYENSREDMEEATASVPKTPEEETNHFDQMKEFLQQMQEKIKELAEKLVNAVKRFFGKGEENERSPEP